MLFALFKGTFPLYVSCCCIGTLSAHPIPWFRKEAVAGADPLPEPWSLKFGEFEVGPAGFEKKLKL